MQQDAPHKDKIIINIRFVFGVVNGALSTCTVNHASTFAR
jgi:hypothetical protein